MVEDLDTKIGINFRLYRENIKESLKVKHCQSGEFIKIKYIKSLLRQIKNI